MTDKDTTDDTEKPSRDELAQRVEQLEQTVQQMLPSRRDALKLGGTALAAGALGSAATGSASAGTNSVGTIGSASSPVDAELEDVNPGSVRAVNFNNNEITNVSSLSTEEAKITNETSIKATRSSKSPSTTASTFVNAYDGASKDSRGEFSSNAIFSPDKTGEYIIVAGVDVRGSTSAGDQIRCRVYNESTDSPVDNDFYQAPQSASIHNSAFIVELKSSDNYKIQVRNADSSFSVNSGANTTGRILRSVIE
jgi:hypothetical protein